MLLNNIENKRSIILNISQFLFIFAFIASASVAGNETDTLSVGESTSITNEKIASNSSSDASSHLMTVMF